MSRITHNNFYSAYTYLNDIYGINLNEDIFETIGYMAWYKIGNKETRMYKLQEVPKKDEIYGWYIDVPCNMYTIEAITTNYEDYQKTSSTTNYPGISSLPTENFIEYLKFGTNDEYISGKLIKYRQIEDKIIFTEPFNIVNVLYKGIFVDDKGLPYLNTKEVHAIATYCAYVDTFKKSLQTKDSATTQQAQLLEQKWNKACSQARVPEYINQNEMNEILNANSSWNRKLYNKTFKPIQ